MERETLKSRLGFILLSAGCAIGIGNVWKFPYMAGQGGGGAFVLFYLLFLVILGLPIMTMEFAVGRASRKSPVRAYQVLEKPGQKWHIHGYFTLIGCYLLMMFYTTVAGWMLHYFYMTAAGKLSGLNADEVAGKFTEMLASPGIMTFWMVFVVVLGILVCAKGLQNGLERVTKGMMIALLLIMVILAVNSLFMDGGRCILQLRGVRPFFSEKFDITKHPHYKYLADADKKNTFDVDRFLSTLRRKRQQVVAQDESFDLYEIDLSDENATE